MTHYKFSEEDGTSVTPLCITLQLHCNMIPWDDRSVHHHIYTYTSHIAVFTAFTNTLLESLTEDPGVASIRLNIDCNHSLWGFERTPSALQPQWRFGFRQGVNKIFSNQPGPQGFPELWLWAAWILRVCFSFYQFLQSFSRTFLPAGGWRDNDGTVPSDVT